MPNLLDQERLVRGEIRHDALQAARVLILDGRLPMFQAGLPAREELATPLRESYRVSRRPNSLNQATSACS